MTIRCAICDRPIPEDAIDAWRPFCSERCKLVDLSNWLGGGYVIPGDPVELPLDDPSAPADGLGGSTDDSDR